MSVLNHFHGESVANAIKGQFDGLDPANMQTRWLGPTLSQALNTLENGVHMLGIVDQYAASVCLMMYRNSNFDRTSLKSSFCDCEATPAGPPFMRDDNTMQQKQARLTTKETASLWSLSLTDLKMLQPLLAEDHVLYGRAWEMFQAQALAVERESGAKVLCLPTSGYGTSRAPKAFGHPMFRFTSLEGTNSSGWAAAKWGG